MQSGARLDLGYGNRPVWDEAGRHVSFPPQPV
jgi:hypothetical protein